MKFIIEHMEPKLFKWCIIEYMHISKIIGKNNLIFTNIKRSDTKRLSDYGKVFNKSISSVQSDLNLKDTILLDQSAKRTLTTNDCKRFKYLIFGGILGDFPRKKRTRKLSTFMKCEKRNLGKRQFSTDNAVLVAKLIKGGKYLKDIPFQDKIEISLKKGESIIFPFRYVLLKDKPFISAELIRYLQKKKGF
ncbi:MAG: SAM-dependent methyltransferase [Candidatus Woesearchaeota archaeon]